LIANLADEGVEAKEEIREPLRLVVLLADSLAELTIDGRGPARGVSGDATGLSSRADAALRVGGESRSRRFQRGERRPARAKAGEEGRGGTWRIPGFLDGGGWWRRALGTSA
jgi:hypothetical protein